jgi:2-polyprenyl-3-methyl-5-hydroxy-6-metoxy-1,4-benzoquinol methylase
MMPTTIDDTMVAAVLRSERDRCRAVGEGDWLRIGQILSDDLTYTHLNGVVEDKTAHIEGLQEKLNWMEREDPPRVRIFGDVAVVTGNLVRHFAARDGRPNLRREMVTLQVWVKSGDDWKLVAHQGTEVNIDRVQLALTELAGSGAFAGRVLDVGCGTGEHALFAASLGLDVTAIDTSVNAISTAKYKARDRGLEVRFIVGDPRGLESLGENFDTVIDAGFFCRLDAPERAAYSSRLRSVVRAHGRAFLLCPREGMTDGVNKTTISENELRSMFAEDWRLDAIDEVGMSLPRLDDDVAAWRVSITRNASAVG